MTALVRTTEGMRGGSSRVLQAADAEQACCFVFACTFEHVSALLVEHEPSLMFVSFGF